MPEDSNETQLNIFRLYDGAFTDANGVRLTSCPEVLSELHRYWEARRGGNRFPARADIDPVDIPALLEHLLLVEVLEDPLDFRYRLVGGHIVHHAGHNIQGKTALGLMADCDKREKPVQTMAMDLGKMVSDLKEPIFAHLRYYAVAADAEKSLQALLLPLGEGDGDLNMVLAGLDYSS
ncbi:PAS domain-containing protein [Pelagibius sp.]|uniref:PAS domain-containing protein n=1 Tax=Pelagibius sp. TaxID=1931238 RepID=UPI003BAF81DE